MGGRLLDGHGATPRTAPLWRSRRPAILAFEMNSLPLPDFMGRGLRRLAVIRVSARTTSSHIKPGPTSMARHSNV
jgi:hypothetical protein